MLCERLRFSPMKCVHRLFQSKFGNKQVFRIYRKYIHCKKKLRVKKYKIYSADLFQKEKQFKIPNTYTRNPYPTYVF